MPSMKDILDEIATEAFVGSPAGCLDRKPEITCEDQDTSPRPSKTVRVNLEVEENADDEKNIVQK